METVAGVGIVVGTLVVAFQAVRPVTAPRVCAYLAGLILSIGAWLAVIELLHLALPFTSGAVRKGTSIVFLILLLGGPAMAFPPLTPAVAEWLLRRIAPGHARKQV